MTRVQVF